MIVTDEQIVEACSKFEFMTEASAYLKMHHNTFIYRAKKLGVYNPKSGGHKVGGSNQYPLKDILSGKYPHYSTSKLKQRLVKARLKQDKCELCGIGNTWNGKPLTLELDHVNGDRTDHTLLNLRVVCPNCHTQTDTYKSKNRKVARVV